MTWNLTRTTGREIYVSHNGNFVARFKYLGNAARATKFIKFLKANFTPEEYFAARDKDMTPIAILETKGYKP